MDSDDAPPLRALDDWQKLMKLFDLQAIANLIKQIREEAIRFVARSEPVDSLSQEENEALSEFVKYLTEA